MLVQSRDQFERVRTVLMAAKEISIDTETTGLLPYEGDRLCGVSTFCKIEGTDYFLSAYFPFRHRPGESLLDVSENLPMEWLKELGNCFVRSDIEQYWCYNWKFDTTMLLMDGIDIRRSPFHDGSIMAHLLRNWGEHGLKEVADLHIDPESSAEEKKLKELLKEYRKGGKKKLSQTYGGYSGIPPKLMEPYACMDAELHWNVGHVLLEKLRAEDPKQLEILQRKYRFVRLLQRIEQYGVGVDRQRCEELSAEAARQMRVLEDQMGFDPGKRLVLVNKLFGSPPEGLGLLPGALSDTPSPGWPHGTPSTSQEILSRYTDVPLVNSVLQYRGLVKAKSTWFDGFTARCDKGPDGRLHPTINPTGTLSGRISESEPNLNQIPRESEEVDVHIKRETKKLFRAGRPRWRLYEFDYSQIELRFAAMYGDATPLLAALRAGQDPHKVTASLINSSRQTAKHATYTVLYGGQASTLARTIERLEFQTTGKIVSYPVEDAQAVLDRFFETYPGMRKVAQQASLLMKRRGYVQLWDGQRRRYWRGYSPKYKRVMDNTHAAFNVICQGGASVVMEESMLRIADQGKGYAYRMVNQVHDSIWVEIVDDFREKWIKEVKYLMEWPSRDKRFVVPFDVDVKLLSVA